MFTAVIPMFLVIRQADTLHEMRKHELGILDEERSREDIRVNVFPTPDSPPPPELPILTVRVENRGEFLVRVVNVWANDQSIESYCTVQPLSYVDMEPFDISETPDSYLVKVTTDRGNQFAADSGTINYLGGGEWEDGMFVINVLIYYDQGGVYTIDVWVGEEIGEPDYTKVIQKSSGTAFTYFDVTTHGAPNTYHVKITRGTDVIYSDQVMIGWPDGPSVAWVFA
ncbi:MAG: hypothetical protein NWE89_06160 [Candidatus Bathyarchaeota archaeon]|nr:hypothetical protein [Candidatus Bathyarchaeota archaeon]